MYYIAITLTNNQSGATANGFQQKISINSNTNSSKYSSKLANVNWQDGAGNILDSWLESGESNTSTASLYWVNLGSNTIAGSGGTFIVYQVIYATSVNAFDGSVTGAEPNYTGTYGQYDNGANVFSALYDNFGGVLLSSLWTSAGGVVVNNGITITGANANRGIYSASSYDMQTYTLEDWAQTSDLTESSEMLCYSTNSGVGAPFSAAYIITADGSNWIVEEGKAAHEYADSASLGATATNVYQLFSIYQDTSNDYGSLNYGTVQSVSTYYTSITSGYLSISEYDAGSTIQIIWIRLRITAPSGIMPSISAGSITPITAPYSSLLLAV